MIIDATHFTVFYPLNPEDWPNHPQRLGDLPKPAPCVGASSPPTTQPATVGQSAAMKRPNDAAPATTDQTCVLSVEDF